MITATEEPVVVNEEIWRAWVRKGRLHEQAAALKCKMAAGTILALAFGSALYWMR
jgi:hypothetical protein